MSLLNSQDAWQLNFPTLLLMEELAHALSKDYEGI